MKLNKRHGLFFTTVLKHGFVLLFSFFFLWAQASSTANFEKKFSNEVSTYDTSVCSSHNPLDIPYDLPVIPATEENESLDDDDSSDNYYFTKQVYDFTVISSDGLIEYIDSSVSHKTELPLFVLYHCWKSFLV